MADATATTTSAGRDAGILAGGGPGAGVTMVKDACLCKGDASNSAAACLCCSKDVLPCESAASALRRKRIEIRRIRILSGNGLFKRSRIQLRGGFDETAEKKQPQQQQQQQQQQQPQQNRDGRDGRDGEAEQEEKRRQRELIEDVALPSLLSSSTSSFSSGELSGLVCSCSPAAAACPPYGTVSVCGRRREMEDAVAAEPDFLSLPCSLNGCSGASTSSSSYHFFGVYDGHGGSQAAAFCRDRLHRVLVDEVKLRSQQVAVADDPDKLWEEAMTGCFLKVDEQVRRPSCGGDACANCEGSGCDVQIPETVGSTAVVAVVGCSRIVVANCGDCRAVLSRGGAAIPLTVDHKPSRPDECARVEAAGGQVINWDIPRILGILAMSRSIGDQYMTPFLIANPDVTCMPRHDSDECLILASDGLWDKVSNEAACDIARKCLSSRRPQRATSNVSATSTTVCGDDGESPCGAAASLLLKVALHNGSKDNITVVVIDLKRIPSSSTTTTTTTSTS